MGLAQVRTQGTSCRVKCRVIQRRGAGNAANNICAEEFFGHERGAVLGPASATVLVIPTSGITDGRPLPQFSTRLLSASAASFQMFVRSNWILHSQRNT